MPSNFNFRKPSKPVKCFVNAGDKAVTLTRCDGEEWIIPMFVSVPVGVREAIIEMLEKRPNAEGKMTATKNITWVVAPEAISISHIKSGDNTGKPVFVVKITDDGLEKWLSEFEITKRGQASAKTAAILAKWLEGKKESPNKDDESF